MSQRDETFSQGYEKMMKARKAMNTSIANASIPWQNRTPVMSGNPLELALASLPLFGGSPDNSESSSASETGSQQTSATSGSAANAGSDTTTQAGGDSATGQDMSPEQVADLLKQVSELTATNANLLKENNTHKAKQQEADRAKMGREEALESQMNEMAETITKMDAALKNQAIMNAIANVKDLEFHDINFVLSKLDPSIKDNMDVDLDNARVTVNGIENEVKRIAREYDWAVKKNNIPSSSNGNSKQNSQQTRPPSSGNPPPPPNGSNDKASRRAALMDKFPVIGHGRAAVK